MGGGKMKLIKFLLYPIYHKNLVQIDTYYAIRYRWFLIFSCYQDFQSDDTWSRSSYRFSDCKTTDLQYAINRFNCYPKDEVLL